MKTYRVYFNRIAEWPQVWSIDEGDQSSEINVIGVELFVPCRSVLGPREHVGSKDHPAAWLECAGVLSIEQGWARIRGSE